jgi:rare lipoprotein A
MFTTNSAATSSSANGPNGRSGAKRKLPLVVSLLSAAILGVGAFCMLPRSSPAEVAPEKSDAVFTGSGLDRTGVRRTGRASFYAKEFVGRKMADGIRMDPQVGNAASKTLPLGTTAKVTNLETGQSAIVTIEDRGPYVADRIVDLSPATAKDIGLTRKQGVANVEIAPIVVPLPQGGLKLGSAAAEMKLTQNDLKAAR